MDWIVAILSIIGVILNIYKNKWCFILWAITNFFWVVIDYQQGLYAQAFLFTVYFVLALWGLYRWKKEE